MRLLTVALVVIYVAGSPLAFGQQTSQEALTLKRLSLTATARKDDTLSSTVSTVQSAFMKRDTAKLASCFGSKKVYVALQSQTGEAGYYSQSQLHFILDKMFRDIRTRSFDYAPRDITISDDGRAYVRSVWTYVVLNSDSVVSERLHFLFEKGKDGWRISELKAVSR